MRLTRLSILLGFLLLGLGLLLTIQSCGTGSSGGGGTSTGGNPQQSGDFQGVLQWKGSSSGNGVYSETTLSPQNVNASQFGKVAHFRSDGVIMAQPLYLRNLDMGSQGKHDVIIIANERDQVLAFDASGSQTDPLWKRDFLSAGMTPAPDNFGGRTNIGGEIGITGTPVIDPSTGAMYFVTTFKRNGAIEQWLHSISVRDGQDFGASSVQIKATIPGDGPGSENGQISFDPQLENQRPGLALIGGNVVIGWGSFSDWGKYRGWLMAYDTKTLKQTAVFSPVTQYQAEDTAYGPADHGGGGSFWAGGAAPSIDSAGNIYVIAADGSFNADSGGKNYGDSVLKLKLSNGTFEVQDYFTPSNHGCIDRSDLEIGSGGLVLLGDLGSGQRAVAISKEGRLYLLNPQNLGKLSSDDSQVPQTLLLGNKNCVPGQGGGYAEGPDWMRSYGNPTFWNGSLYMALANTRLRKYSVNGTVASAPDSISSTVFWLRGANTVVSANGTSNGIVWASSKNEHGVEELRAFDATDVNRELWNNVTKGADFIGAGTPFAVPVVADAKVILAGRNDILVYGVLK